MLVEITYKLNKEKSRKVNELEDKREVLLIKRSSKSECRYWLVVRLIAIKYKKNFLCYLFSIASLHLYSLKT